MASNRIKGITVEIGGDVTGLDKALKEVNGNIKKHSVAAERRPAAFKARSYEHRAFKTETGSFKSDSR